MYDILELNDKLVNELKEIARLMEIANYDELRKQELRKKIALGLDSLQRGEGVDGDEFFSQLEGEEAALDKAPAA